jgi:CRISPR/Cas system endoribonuclease Cas6 (RAMP superfamily)
LALSELPSEGFSGFCAYKISGVEAAVSSQAAQLAEFSLYCGTGYKTTMGLGQTRPA